ncbi:hypothetical protein EXN66_Car011760 [Channa argus]|uniref:Uncharacterized protein n=1 Tax=Channa argus TaxID=215402 RepID=A0A6G1Q112_CHAAH|nr:hypothetical protein EXN66_Car011760 [Channa argus]KAK2902421.1 hypothetical protein Q8A73_012167 [Channa argus]
MASSYRIWIAIYLLTTLTVDTGVFGRAVHMQEFLSPLPKPADETSVSTLFTDAWRRGMMETHRERCAELAAPWLENTQHAHEDNATMLQLRVRPFHPGTFRGQVFPGKSLFNFVRRVYHCCQEGQNCRSVKGIQGVLSGDTAVEFLLTREILSLTVVRVELHLQLTNPQHLDIHPMLPFMAKHNLPTRYNSWSRGNTVELRMDLLFLFQSLQEAVGGARKGPSLVNMRRVVLSSSGALPGERAALHALQDTDGDMWGDEVANRMPVVELGLVLGCSQAGSGVSCRTGGIHLSHTPFLALYHK